MNSIEKNIFLLQLTVIYWVDGHSHAIVMLGFPIMTHTQVNYAG